MAIGDTLLGKTATDAAVKGKGTTAAKEAADYESKYQKQKLNCKRVYRDTLKTAADKGK